MSNKCVHCNNIFKNKSILNKHQTTAKYCLSKQNSQNKQNADSSIEFVCDTCDKGFSLKDSYQKHVVVCCNRTGIVKLTNTINTKDEEIKLLKNDLKNTGYLHEIIEEQKNTIKELQDKLENIAIKAVQRPTTTNRNNITNYIQNMLPLTDQVLIDNAQYLTIEHIKKGAEGYAEYALDHPLKDRIVCSDMARKKIKYKDVDGKVVVDPDMSTISKQLFLSIKNKNNELVNACCSELKDDLGNEKSMDIVTNICDSRMKLNVISDGSVSSAKSIFHEEFVKHVCKHTIKE